jgi:hypothetical protein
MLHPRQLRSLLRAAQKRQVSHSLTTNLRATGVRVAEAEDVVGDVVRIETVAWHPATSLRHARGINLKP